MKNFIIVWLLVLTARLSYSAVIYVDCDAAAAGDGSSWTNAYIHLQDALNYAEEGDEVWVAEGIYRPDLGDGLTPGDRTASFQLKSGVALYGGFTGIESLRTQRDWQVNQTTLSGDLNSDDGANFSNNTENAYQIVNGSGAINTTVLDGFTVTGGNANESSGNIYGVGSGMYIHSGSPTVSNCTFAKNWATNSPVWVAESFSVFSNCSFTENYSAIYAGAFYAFSGCEGGLESCAFTNNFAADNGGAVRVRGSSCLFSINNCSFTQNLTQAGGGAIVIVESAYVEISHSTFTDNKAMSRGGAIYLCTSSEVDINGCSFDGNTSPYGGGIRCWDAGSMIVQNCVFKNNGTSEDVTTLHGGVLFSSDSVTMAFSNSYFLSNSAESSGCLCLNGSPSTAVVVNCVFAGNAAGTGGAIRVYNCTTDITNCTFYGNIASTNNQGRAVAVETTGLLNSINNSILWEGGHEIFGDNGTFTVNYSNLEGSWSGRGGNNISTDPYFISPEGVDGIIGTEDDDVRLYGDSPCINTGSNTLIPGGFFYDVKGDARIGESIVDMGAYEEIGCGDSGFPFPRGDLDYNCRVDIGDLSVLASNWLVCTDSGCDP